MHYLSKLIGIKPATNKVILVTTSDVKAEVLNYRNQHQVIDNLKIMTEAEFISSFIFKSSKENIQYLIEHNPWLTEELNVDIAKNLEQVLATIDYLNLTNHQLYPTLIEYQQAGYQIEKPNLPAGYEVITYLPYHSDLLEMIVVTESDADCSSINCQKPILEFSHILDEIEYTIENIVQKLVNGASLEDITIIAPANYHPLIKQVGLLYKLPIATENKISILAHNDGNRLWQQVISGEELNFENCDLQIAEAVINILNEYSRFGSYKKFIKQVKADFKAKQITTSKSGGITLKTKIESKFTTDKLENGHFYLLGNYQDGLISYKQDVELISDKDRVGQLLTSEQLNDIFDRNLKRLIVNANNIQVSYSKKLVASDVEIANNLGQFPVTVASFTAKSEYSEASDRLRYARANYLKEVFNAQSQIYTNLDNYFQVDYKDNKFTGVNREYSNLKLSYTSINDYYKCSYKYYLSHILRIRNGKFDNKKVIVGNVVHGVLESLDLERELDAKTILNLIYDYVKQMELEPTPAEKLYFNKLSIFLEAVCHYMKIEEAQIDKQINREQEYEMDIIPNVTLVGKIDKIISEINGDNLHVDIYDYKTGVLTINFDNVEYGFDLQNLIYFLLIKNYYQHESGEEVLMGTYQQQIRSKVLYDEEEVLDMMKIKGFTKQKHDYLFKRTEKVINEEQVAHLLEVTNQKIEEAAVNITANQFAINPKVINGKNKSCDFCEYQSICNKTNADIIYINKEK